MELEEIQRSFVLYIKDLAQKMREEEGEIILDPSEEWTDFLTYYLRNDRVGVS